MPKNLFINYESLSGSICPSLIVYFYFFIFILFNILILKLIPKVSRELSEEKQFYDVLTLFGIAWDETHVSNSSFFKNFYSKRNKVSAK